MSQIDLEIDRFFGEMASMRIDIQEYEDWCRKYESFRYNYPQWTMKSGEKISIWDMNDNHLINTINLLQRKDSENTWLKVLNQEKTYRELLSKIKVLKEDLFKMEEISDLVF